MVAKERGFRVIGEEAVKAATGKSWPYWFRILDRFDVKAKGHTLAAKYLADKHGLGPWWAQAVAIRYEWERGLRKAAGPRRRRPS